MNNEEHRHKVILTNLGFAISLLIFFLAMNFSDTGTGGWIHQKFDSTFYGNQIADVCFVDSVTGYAVTPYTGPNVTQYIIKTTNAGYNWNVIRTDNLQYNGFNRVIFLNKDKGFVCGNHGLEKTTNGGINWINIQLATGIHPTEMFVLNEDTIWYVIADNLFGGLWRTTNGGVNWVQQLPGGTNSPYRIYMYNSQIGFLRTISSSAIYKTTNSGFNWTYIQTTGAFDDLVMLDSLTGYRAAGPGTDSVFKTTNGGLNWIGQKMPIVPNVFMNSRVVKDLYAFNKDTLWGVAGRIQFYNNIYRYKALIYKTTNGGLNWGYQIPDTNFDINIFYFTSFYNISTGWCTAPSTTRGGVYTETGGDTTLFTGMLNNNFIYPDIYILEQNYPNPFNSMTNVKFKMLNPGFVEIKIYDITGKMVRILTSKNYEEGEHIIKFDGGNLPSGVYFYRIEVTDSKSNKIFSETKSMIYLK